MKFTRNFWVTNWIYCFSPRVADTKTDLKKDRQVLRVITRIIQIIVCWTNVFCSITLYCSLTKSVFYSLFCLHHFGFVHSLLWPQITACCPQQRTIQPNSSSPSSVSPPVVSAVSWVTAASLGAFQCVNSLWEVDGRGSWRRTSSSSDRYPSISLTHTFLSII